MNIAICEVIEKFTSILPSVCGIWALGNLLTWKHYYVANIILLKKQEGKGFCFLSGLGGEFMFGFVFLSTV